MFDFEFGEVFEDPAIFERVIDDRQQLARGGDDGLARAATFLDALILWKNNVLLAQKVWF